MIKKHVRRQRDVNLRLGNQRGISLTEAILGVATLGVGLGAIANLQIDNLRKVKAEQTAQQLAAVRDAAAAYVIDNYGDIIDGGNADIGDPVDGGPAQQLADAALDGYLDGRFIDGGNIRKNQFGHDINIYVLNVGGDRLRVQVITEDDGTGTFEPIIPETAAQIAASIGADAGWRVADPGDLAFGQDATALYDVDRTYGSFGGWELTNADMGTPPDPGGLTALAFFGEGGVVADFLYRNSVPGRPEAQQMNANINMDDFGLANVSQIGGRFNLPLPANAALDSNPEFGQNGNNTNLPPAPIPDVFASPDEVRVDTDADGFEEDIFGAAGVGAADNQNTIRFGADNQSFVNPVYQRGNANIIANDAIFGTVDAEESLRAQRLVSAVNRGDTRGQRVQLDSGLDPDTGDPAAGVAFGLSSFDDVAESAIIPGGRERTRLSTQTTGGVETGQLVMSDADMALGGASVPRVEANYGLNVAGVAQATAGGIALSDDAGVERYRTNYGQDVFNANAPEVTAGTQTMSDSAGVVRSQTAFTSAGGARGVTFFNDGVQERVRMDYGFDEAGGADVAAGNLVMRDDQNRARFEQRYIDPTSGRLAIREQGLFGADEERFVADYAGTAGNIALRDQRGDNRFVANIANDGNGSLTMSSGAAGGSEDRFITDYAGGNTSSRIVTPGTADVRTEMSIAGATAQMRVADGTNDRFLANYTSGTEGIASLSSAGGVERFAGDYNGVTGRLAISDDGANPRFRAQYGTDQGQVEVFNGAQRRFGTTYTAANGDIILTDQAANDRFSSTFTGATDGATVISSAGQPRFEYEYSNANTIRRVTDAAGDIREELDVAAGTYRINDVDAGGNAVARLFLNTTTGEMVLADTDASAAAPGFGGGGSVAFGPTEGAMQLNSADDDTAYIDFVGAGNIGDDMRGRFAYVDDTGGGPGRFTFQTEDQAIPTFGVREGELLIRGNTANEGGQITFSPDNTALLEAEGATTWNVDVQNNDFRIFYGSASAGNANAAFRGRVVGGNAKVRMGGNNLLGGVGLYTDSPLGATRSTLDVDDIYLRGRRVWLSETNLNNQLTVVGVQVRQNGQQVAAGIRNRCTSPVGGGAGGTLFYQATPAWWVTPTIIAQTRLTQSLEPGNFDAVSTVDDVQDINPSNNVEITGTNGNNTYDNNTQGRVYMDGNGRVFLEGRQRNDIAGAANNGWRTMTGAYAIVTVYCQI